MFSKNTIVIKYFKNYTETLFLKKIFKNFTLIRIKILFSPLREYVNISMSRFRFGFADVQSTDLVPFKGLRCTTASHFLSAELHRQIMY